MSSAAEQASSALPQGGAIARIDELKAYMVQLHEKANLVSPFVSMDFIPEMHRVSFRSVLIDTTIQEKKVTKGDRTYTNYVGTDTYFDPKFCEKNERALAKPGILKIFRAAGIDLVRSGRVDDRQDSLYGEWLTEVDVPELDGRRTRMQATKVVDLRPGSPQRKLMSEAQAEQACRWIMENAETKCLLRAARGALQLRQKYTVEELSKPFVIPVLVFDPDMSDPETKRMYTQHALGLYGPKRLPPGKTIALGEDPATVVVDASTGEVIERTVQEAPLNPDDFPTIEPEPEIVKLACKCPCNCPNDMSPEMARLSESGAGAVRCARCYPGGSYDAERHAALKSLELPKFPAMTPAQAALQASKARERAAQKKTA